MFFGVAVFDFEGNGVVINLHASMKEPEKFNKVLILTLMIYVSSLCIFSSIAYWVSTPITYNFPNTLPIGVVIVLRTQLGGHGYAEFAT